MLGNSLGISLGISLGVELSTGVSDSVPDDVVVPDGEQANRAAARANNRIERFNNKGHLLGAASHFDFAEARSPPGSPDRTRACASVVMPLPAMGVAGGSQSRGSQRGGPVRHATCVLTTRDAGPLRLSGARDVGTGGRMPHASRHTARWGSDRGVTTLFDEGTTSMLTEPIRGGLAGWPDREVLADPADDRLMLLLQYVIALLAVAAAGLLGGVH